MTNQILFSVDIAALSSQQLEVVRFTGTESLSDMYRFNIVLVGNDQVAEGSDALNKEASLTFHAKAGDFTFHGIVTRFELLQQADKRTFYRAILRPRLWRTTLDCNSRIFLDKTIPQCIEDCLRGLGLSQGVDYEMRLQRQYPEREYVSQYNESTYTFLSRWMEREGIYFFFDHSGPREKLVLTDASMAHEAVPGAKALSYAPPSGLTKEHEEDQTTRLNAKHSLVPQKLLLKDYNYRTPELEIKAQKVVSANGVGTVYSYADNIKTPSEADALATVRAQALACKELLCTGESASPFVRAGWLFSVKDHYEASLNETWLALRVQHGGNQEGYIFSGVGGKKDEDVYFYRNTFEGIPGRTQFRAEDKTARPKMAGAFGAHIDAAGSGQYAELDEHGRYTVIMPWDRSGRKDGKASHRLRMAEPYGGRGHGMHFPLHKGTEALLGYVDGDPDRPVIEGAAPDPEHPSQVTAETQTQCRLTTKGQNKFHIEDKAGSQRMLISTPTENTYARMGSHNDPPPDWSPSEDMAGWKLNTNKLFDVQAGSKNSVILGNSFISIVGWEHRETGGLRTYTTLGLNLGIFLAYTKEFAPFESKIHQLGVFLGLEKSKLIDNKVHMAEERLHTSQEHVKLANSSVKLAQQKTSLAENKTTLAEQKTDIAQSDNQLAQTQTQLAASRTQASQNNVRMAQQTTLLAQNRTGLAAESMEASQDVTRLAEERVSMCADNSQIAESINEVCSMKTTVAAEQNDM